MQLTFKNKKISSMLGILPQNEYFFDDEVDNYSFSRNQTMRMKKVMGYNKHRLAKKTSTVSDFAVFGLKYILDNNWIRRDEIGALIVVSLCPDYFVPQISGIVQAECGLPETVFCMDISQGCCAYIQGLMESFLLLNVMDDKKVVLINGDVLSHKVSNRDRNDFPLSGDATTITVIENSDENEIYTEINTNGNDRNALIIPAGGFRRPSDNETCVMIDQGDGNFRTLDNMHMDGTAVFNFVQREVPPMVTGALSRLNMSVEDIDLFLFHQPNRFMLKKLADKIGIPYEKIPMNLVENYGNPSGASIPMVTMFNYAKELVENKYKVCFSAFGSGLSWGMIVMELGNLKNCEIIESDL